MTERSRIFAFNIIDGGISPPQLRELGKSERAREREAEREIETIQGVRARARPWFVGHFQYAQLETAQSSSVIAVRDRGHAFLSDRCVNTLHVHATFLVFARRNRAQCAGSIDRRR